jgi:hypothetical protein
MGDRWWSDTIAPPFVVRASPGRRVVASFLGRGQRWFARRAAADHPRENEEVLAIG